MKLTSDTLNANTVAAATAKLSAGGTVTVASQPAGFPNLVDLIGTPELKALAKQYQSANLAYKPVLTIDPHVHNAIVGHTWTPAQQVALGAGGGALTGLGAGLVLDAIRHASPTTGALLAVGLALVGTGIGAGMAGGVVGSVKFNPLTGNFELAGVAAA